MQEKAPPRWRRGRAATPPCPDARSPARDEGERLRHCWRRSESPRCRLRGFDVDHAVRDDAGGERDDFYERDRGVCRREDASPVPDANRFFVRLPCRCWKGRGTSNWPSRHSRCCTERPLQCRHSRSHHRPAPPIPRRRRERRKRYCGGRLSERHGQCDCCEILFHSVLPVLGDASICLHSRKRKPRRAWRRAPAPVMRFDGRMCAGLSAGRWCRIARGSNYSRARRCGPPH